MPMQEREYATPAKRRRKKCALKFSSSKQIKKAKMDKKLCRVTKGDNTEIYSKQENTVEP